MERQGMRTMPGVRKGREDPAGIRSNLFAGQAERSVHARLAGVAGRAGTLAHRQSKDGLHTKGWIPMRRLVSLALLLGLFGCFGCCHDTCDCCTVGPCSMSTGGTGCGGCASNGLSHGHLAPVPAGGPVVPTEKMPPPTPK
jgi:hypothetical protein